MRAALRVLIGKGSVEDIINEAALMSTREKINLKELDNEDFKKFLVDRRLGVDCSGLAYYILDAESTGRGSGHLREHMTYPYSKNIFRKLLCKLRPIENTGTTTFTHERNSREIKLTQAMPGDYIVMLYTGIDKNYHHMITIHQVDYGNGSSPEAKKLYYTHSFAWPSDGKYNHGARQGTIDIIDPAKSIVEQTWTEQGKTGTDNFTQEKARESMYVSVRRLNWF